MTGCIRCGERDDLVTDGGVEYVLVPRFKSRGVFHDPDPANPDEPGCDRAKVTDGEWQRRSPETLGDRFTYCQFCDPDEEVAPQKPDGGELAAQLRGMDADDIGDGRGTLIPDGGGVSCSHCQQPITGDPAQYRDEPVHYDCHLDARRDDEFADEDECQLCRLLGYRGDEINEPTHRVEIEGDVATKLVYCCERCGEESHFDDDPSFESLDDLDGAGAAPVATDGGHVPDVQVDAAVPSADRGRDWTCAGCDQFYHGPPELVENDPWRTYCSLQCYVDDQQFLGDRAHKCDCCGQVFGAVGELADHDCDPTVEVLVDREGR